MVTQYPLVFFTLLMCLCAGMIGVQGWLLYTQRGTKKFHQVMTIVELVAIVAGGFASFLHLHHWERLFNGFMHLSSGITQELIGVVVIVLTIAITFVYLRKHDGAPDDTGALVPKWNGILCLVVGVIMGFVCAHSYDMASRPAWSNATLYLFYYSSEFVLGAVGTWLVAAATKQDEQLGAALAKLTCIAGVVSAVVMVIAGVYYTTIQFYSPDSVVFHTTEPTQPAADPEGILASVISGSNALLFWGGAVFLGSIVAAVCGFLKMRTPGKQLLPYATCAFCCTLVGAVCFRVVLYVVGVGFYVYF